MKKFLVFACATVLLIGLSVPAMADVNFYGRVYFDTFVLDADKEQAQLANAAHRASAAANAVFNNSAGFSVPQAPVVGGTTGNDDSDLVWGLNKIISRFGANFKSGKLSANVEIRPFSASYFRHWWADYDFGSFAIRAGKWWDPTFFASQGVNSLFGGGIAYGANPTGDAAARLPMMRLDVPLPNKLGNWYLAFGENSGAAVAAVPGAAEYDVTLPKIVTSLRLNFAPTSWLLYAGYQNYDEVGRAASGAETEYDIDSYLVGLSGNANFGPIGLGANIWWAQNAREYTLAAAAITDTWLARYDATTNGIQDADFWGLQLKGTFKFNDMVSLELGYGYRNAERLDFTNRSRDDEDDCQQFDIVVPINVAKGMTLYPTITLYDDKDSYVAGVTTDEGEAIVYGITWAFFF
jgi:hypothetical protein